MSEEFCDGVKILLKRMESNPEEFKGQDNKWSAMIPKGSGGYIDWNHALTEEELKALAEGMRKIYRIVYTEKVMSTLLYSTEEELAQVQPGTWVSSGSSGGGTIGTGLTYPTLSPFTESQLPKTKPTIGELLKQKLAKI